MRPVVICHMTCSLDGKVTGDFLSSPAGLAAAEEYYAIHRNFSADAFACGRVTMEGSFTGGCTPDLSPFRGQTLSRTDHIAVPDARFFAVAFDRRGRLGWQTSFIRDEDPGYDNAHVVEVLCEDTPDERLCWLQKVGVSYLFAGKEELDIPLALEKLGALGIRTLLLEGGSLLNGAFLRAGVIDELSLVVAPITADGADGPLFAESIQENYRLTAARPLAGDCVWLRYQKKGELL